MSIEGNSVPDSASFTFNELDRLLYLSGCGSLEQFNEAVRRDDVRVLVAFWKVWTEREGEQ